MPEIQLSAGYTSIVDEKDYEYLGQWKWSTHHCRAGLRYAYRYPYLSGKRVAVRMHRVIMERVLGGPIPKGCEVDHIDGNALNNQRDNLRLATSHQNQMNRGNRRNSLSSFKGVCFCKESGKWRAKICVSGKTTHLGRHDTEEQAARAYDAKAKGLHGAFARLNFPDE